MFDPRPSDREVPGPGQESVWDYPRPPAVEPCECTIRIVMNGGELAHSKQAHRVLETSHPPVYYLPPEDLDLTRLRRCEEQSFCEWKGIARYWAFVDGERCIDQIAWSYPTPSERFSAIRNHLAFYPSRVDECYVDGERVMAQAGDFYGGWITSKVVGPFKGGPGTRGW